MFVPLIQKCEATLKKKKVGTVLHDTKRISYGEVVEELQGLRGDGFTLAPVLQVGDAERPGEGESFQVVDERHNTDIWADSSGRRRRLTFSR